MTVVAHLGPPVASSGGPAGYLKQLTRAFEDHGAGSAVIFPPVVPPGVRKPLATRVSHFGIALHRVRRAILGAPKFYRPEMDSVRRRGGALQTLFDNALAETAAENAASLSSALQHRADVLFAHNLTAAEAALGARGTQQVWMMLHTPMAIGLYLAWSWGVPELDWRELMALPDV